MDLKFSPPLLDTFSMEDILALNSILDMKEDYEMAKLGRDLIIAERQQRKK